MGRDRVHKIERGPQTSSTTGVLKQYSTKITLTQNDIKSLGTTAIELIPAVASKLILIDRITILNTFDIAAFGTASRLYINYGGVAGANLLVSNSAIHADTQSKLYYYDDCSTFLGVSTPADVEGVAVMAVADANATGGGANSLWTIEILYRISGII